MQQQNDSLDNLLKELRFRLDSYRRKHLEARSRGENYNVFEVLGVESSELSHSAFIAHLLNPAGTHALGEKPLRLFIEKMCRDVCPDTFDLGKAVVRTEVPVDGKAGDEWGRMDIVVQLTDEWAIIVENKIYAGDQPMQLRRYHDYAEHTYRQSRLLYLTPDGKPASDYSTSGLRENFDYYPVSYRKEISEWLDECISLAARKPLVREVLVQYRRTVETLAGTDRDAVEREPIYWFVLEHGEAFSAVFGRNDLGEERKFLDEILQLGFFQYGLRHLIGRLCRYAEGKGLTFHADTLLSGGRYCGFCFKKAGWNKTILFQFTQSGWKGCYYGVHSHREVEPGQQMRNLRGAKPNEHFCYGNSYTKYKNWDIEGLVAGKIRESVIEAVEETIRCMEIAPDIYDMR